LPSKVLSQRLSDIYAIAIAKGELEGDPAQKTIVERLDTLQEEIAALPPSKPLGFYNKLFNKHRNKSKPRGLYIWGKVGRGKSMLMDLFYQNVAEKKKLRVHFHAFMHDIHQQIYQLRQKQSISQNKTFDPLKAIAEQIASRYRLLCFDEFVVNDITDAMILGRLFKALFDLDLIIVATSNVPPEKLYENGLNRALFLPFIQMLRDNLDSLNLASPTDYRLEKIAGLPVYYSPLGPETDAKLDALFLTLTGVSTGVQLEIDVLGRKLIIPNAVNQIARISFSELCESPLGNPDYLAIARHFHTLFIDRIPILAPHQRNEAKRFIHLIDTLYDQHVKLFASAQTGPTGLYPDASGIEAVEFDRTISRLIEMQSADYLKSDHKGILSTGSHE
jgi:cell division protein ZapE